MLSDKKYNAVCLCCYSTVSHMFAVFHNFKYCGVNFTWEHFPEMMEKQCAAQVHLNVLSSSTKQEKEIEALAAKRGREIAEELIKIQGEQNIYPTLNSLASSS